MTTIGTIIKIKSRSPPGVYAVVECSCHVSLAVSIFLTVGLSVERFQASPFFSLIFFAILSFLSYFFLVFGYLSIASIFSQSVSIFLTVGLSVERFQASSFFLVESLWLFDFPLKGFRQVLFFR